MEPNFLTISVALLTGAIGILGFLLMAMTRQIGILHERVAPMGAMVSDRGPEVGEMAPDMRVATFTGAQINVGGGNPTGRSRLLFFVAPSCPICKKLIPITKAYVNDERLDVIFIGDGDPDAQAEMRRAMKIDHLPYVNSPQVGIQYQVSKLPYAVLIDGAGVIRAKGLVNSREHLESLVVAQEQGVASIQEYLEKPASPPVLTSATH